MQSTLTCWIPRKENEKYQDQGENGEEGSEDPHSSLITSFEPR